MKKTKTSVVLLEGSNPIGKAINISELTAPSRDELLSHYFHNIPHGEAVALTDLV